LKEVDRVLRPNGYFVYSAPPAYRSDKDFPHEWSLILNYTSSICWKLIAREVQTAIWQKTSDRACLLDKGKNLISLCDADDDPDKSWNKQMKNCIYFDDGDIKPLPPWPGRLWAPPGRLQRMYIFPYISVLFNMGLENVTMTC
jgi:hypothetical protein